MNTPSPQNRLPTIIVLLIVTLVIPSAAAASFADQVTQHPWQWLGWGLLYELLVLIGSFIVQIWQKLQGKWVDRLAEKIDYSVQNSAPNYDKRYLEHLRYRHCNFDVKGLTTQGVYTLDLQRVFVELRMAPRPVNEMRNDPIAPIPQELRGQKPIWDYLRHSELKNLAIIGVPGGGKTTMLKYVTLSLASGSTIRNQLQAPNLLPILLFLRDHANEIANDSSLSLESAICVNLKQKDGPQPPEGWFTARLQSGRCLILLDGLDEVADAEKRKQVVQWVERQVVAYPHSRFVVTSRPHGYRSNPIEGVTVLEVQPFNLKQVGQFVNNWYLANEIMSAGRDDPGVRMEAKSGAEDLLKRLRSTATLAELAVNPLMLTMIATVHRYRSSLPGRRVELYAEVCEVFLGKRQASKGLVQSLTPLQKQRVLQPLAYYLMTHEKREIAQSEAIQVIAHPLTLVTGSGEAEKSEEFLKVIENESGLLIEREAGDYSFAHLAFQEYLAAVHIREQRLEDTLTEQVNNAWWHETIRLYCAQGDATSILAACLADDLPPVLALTLAIECVEEAKEVDPILRQRLNDLVNKGAEGDVE